MPDTPLTAKARNLRSEQTSVETLLWDRLRNRKLGGFKWKRQVPRGSYIVDFLCPERSLVVELDGGQHADKRDYDARRTAWLEREGLHVLRFWNVQIIENLDGVCELILAICQGKLPPTTPTLDNW